MYKATNIDTDKALKAIEAFRRNKSLEQQKELYGIQKYYEGLEKGLELAESLFECSNYEKKESETTHTKIQYKDHEYSISEFCRRMEELEQLVKNNEWSDDNGEKDNR